MPPCLSPTAPAEETPRRPTDRRDPRCVAQPPEIWTDSGDTPPCSPQKRCRHFIYSCSNNPNRNNENKFTIVLNVVKTVWPEATSFRTEDSLFYRMVASLGSHSHRPSPGPGGCQLRSSAHTGHLHRHAANIHPPPSPNPEPTVFQADTVSAGSHASALTHRWCLLLPLPPPNGRDRRAGNMGGQLQVRVRTPPAKGQGRLAPAGPPHHRRLPPGRGAPPRGVPQDPAVEK